ncbi:MAG TPA: 2,4-dihydroxyhept-2-ene-1,7-dioic acid aldolase [Actinobacteria bacterium]|nr:2,4-dihydroxyhept-2-ene-1,7-dioic acid aldolase [Actinomycetota bacterium]
MFDPSLTTIGSWLQLADPAITEMMARAGFDWLVVDLEHTATGIDRAAEAIRIGDLAGVPMFVRLSGHDPAQIKRVLDAGARGIIAPTVRSRAEAEALVEAAFYPPRGRRGVGLSRAQGFGLTFEAYRDGAARDVVVVAQIEDADGVRNLDEILAVDGITGFFVGPYDLSGSLGRPGEFDHPEVRSALDELDRHLEPGGPMAGIHVVEPDPARLAAAVERGYRFVAFSSDMLIFSHRTAELAEAVAEVRRDAR